MQEGEDINLELSRIVDSSFKKCDFIISCSYRKVIYRLYIDSFSHNQATGGCFYTSLIFDK